MNILSATNTLFKYFLTNDIFCLDEYNKHFLLVEDVELNKQVVKLALDQMEKNELVCGFGLGSRRYYVLNRSLNNYEQTITLSAGTCNTIASLLNEIYQNDVCNAMNITSGDINELLEVLVNELKGQESQEEI